MSRSKNINFYQKYRPNTFATIAGQEVIVKILRQQIKHEAIHHAYLFSGKQGIGKTTTARVFAKTINCLNLSSATDRCFKCSWCLKLEEQTLDINEIDAASNNGVENIRALKDDAVLSPILGRFKVYIIDEVHMLSRSAFNAFLKILEEPPRHVVFILATTELEKLPATIVSRCHHFRFRNLNYEKLSLILAKIAQNEKIKIATTALQAIAKHTNGAVRDALNLLEQAATFFSADQLIDLKAINQLLGTMAQDQVYNLFEPLLTRHFTKIWPVLDRWKIQNVNFAQMAEKMVKFCNDVRIQNLFQQTVPFKRFPLFQPWTARDFIILEKIASLIVADLSNFQLNIDPKIMFENLILKIIQILPPLYHFEEQKYLLLLRNNDVELKKRLKKTRKTLTPSLVVFQEIKLLAATSKALLLLITEEVLKFLQDSDGKQQFEQFCLLNKWEKYQINFISFRQRDFIKTNFTSTFPKQQ